MKPAIQPIKTDAYVMALRLAEAGYSVIPIDLDPNRQSGKAPSVSWSRYQKAPADPKTIGRWFNTTEPRGVGVVGGPVSGNLLIIDFESVTLADQVADDFPVLHPEYAHLIPGTIQATTPKPGRHWYIRIADPPTPFPRSEKLAHQADDAGRLMIANETRGDGGYAVAPPAPGREWIHPTGEKVEAWPYDAVLKLLDLCRSFDEANDKPGETTSTPRGTPAAAGGTRPGDIFNARNDWPAIIEPHGWRHVRGRYWQRPGKDGNATSASITPHGNLYIFSSNAAPFPAGQSVTKFRAYALLNHAGDNAAAARALAREYGPSIMAEAHAEDDRQAPRPTIPIDGDEMVMRESVMAVIKDDPRLYRLEGTVVSPARRTDRETDRGAVLMRETTEGLLRAIITERCILTKPTRSGETIEANCPAYLPKAIIESAGQPTLVPLRSIRGIINGPTINESGQLINRAGYARIQGEGWYVAHGIEELFDIVPDHLDRKDAEDAARCLFKVIDDFPWKDRRLGQAKWIATLLAQLARPLFPRCPATLITANAPGSGKTLLARLIGLIAHGDEPPLMAWPAGRHDDAEDETRKRLGALAASGTTLAIIDNLKAGGGWDSDSLCNAVTSGAVIDRSLGSNSASSMTPRRFMAQLIATGNNVSPAGDLADRSIVIELESTDSNRRETPTDQYAIGEAAAYVMRNRTELLGASLTILSAYLKAGRPPAPGAAWGNFDEYVALIINAVRWSTGIDPLEDRVQQAQRTDPVASALITLVSAWNSSFGDLPIPTRFMETRLAAPDADDGTLAIAEALATLGAVKLNGHAIGKLLQRYAGRTIADPTTGHRYQLTKSERGGNAHACRWSVARL